MSAILPGLKNMSRPQMLEAMEEIWAELSKDDSWESPPWHDELLQEREGRFRAGLEIPIPWEEAKKQLLALGKTSATSTP